MRSDDWKYENQDGIIDDASVNFKSLQVGVVQQMYVYSDQQQEQEANGQQPVKEISDYISAIPTNDFENSCLIEIKWLGNRYDDAMEAMEVVKTLSNGLYDFEERDTEKYRYGYEDKFDVVVVGQHTALPLVPFDKFMRSSSSRNSRRSEEAWAKHKEFHRLKLDVMKKQNDVLGLTAYKQMKIVDDENKNEDEKADAVEFDEYERALLIDSDRKKWPKVVVEKLNQSSDSFLSRFVDVSTFDNHR